MPLRNGRLTGLEKGFIRAMATPKTIEQAAHEAGYKNRQSGYALMQKPEVRDAIREETLKMLHDKYGPAAVHEVASIGFDKQQPGGTRIKALVKIAEWAGIGSDGDDEAKELHEMTLDELKRRGDKLERQLATIHHMRGDRATMIEAEAIEQEDSPSDEGVFS